VGGDLVVLEAGGCDDRGDDVVRALDRQAGAALVEKQGGGVGAGPVGAFVQPAGEGAAQVGVDRDLADLLALAENPQDALARRQLDVVDIQAGDLGDPGAGVKRDERDRAIARRRALLCASRRNRTAARVLSAFGAVRASSARAAFAGPRPRRM